MAKTRLDKMVDEFAEKMKTRLRQKSRDGWKGWDEEWFHEGEISERIVKQVITGDAYKDLKSERQLKPIDPIDLANYCAFLDLKREESTNG
jgi:hypothetical protein